MKEKTFSKISGKSAISFAVIASLLSTTAQADCLVANRDAARALSQAPGNHSLSKPILVASLITPTVASGAIASATGNSGRSLVHGAVAGAATGGLIALAALEEMETPAAFVGTVALASGVGATIGGLASSDRTIRNATLRGAAYSTGIAAVTTAATVLLKNRNDRKSNQVSAAEYEQVADLIATGLGSVETDELRLFIERDLNVAVSRESLKRAMRHVNRTACVYNNRPAPISRNALARQLLTRLSADQDTHPFGSSQPAASDRAMKSFEADTLANVVSAPPAQSSVGN